MWAFINDLKALQMAGGRAFAQQLIVTIYIKNMHLEHVTIPQPLVNLVKYH
jgi:hypothetical protein